MTARQVAGAGPATGRPGARRHRAAVAWVLATAVVVAPYAALKVAWLSGAMIGIPPGSPARGPDFVLANALTLLLDLGAVLVVYGLASGVVRLSHMFWPAWVGTGFLAPVLVQVPVGFAASLVRTGRPVSMAGGLVDGWAYAVVYGSFLGQAVIVTLLVARAFIATTRDGGPAHRQGSWQLQLGFLAAVAAVPIAALRLFEAAVAPSGWHQSPWTLDNRLGVALQGLAALAAVIALLRSVRLRSVLRRRAGPPPGPGWLAAGLVGTGVVFAYGLLATAGLASGTDLAQSVPPPERLLNLAGVLAGLAGVVHLAATLLDRGPVVPRR